MTVLMEQVPTAVLSAERCHLGEGPTYDAFTDTAWWFDIRERRLFEHRFANGCTVIHTLPNMASALARIDNERSLRTWMLMKLPSKATSDTSTEMLLAPGGARSTRRACSGLV